MHSDNVEVEIDTTSKQYACGYSKQNYPECFFLLDERQEGEAPDQRTVDHPVEDLKEVGGAKSSAAFFGELIDDSGDHCQAPRKHAHVQQKERSANDCRGRFHNQVKETEQGKSCCVHEKDLQHVKTNYIIPYLQNKASFVKSENLCDIVDI